MKGSQKKGHDCYLASTKRIRAQTKVGATIGEVERPRSRNVCTLEVPGENPKKGRTREEIQSIRFDERDLKKFFRIGTTLGAEYETILIRVLKEYRDIFA
ncbi:hypothetical protein LIER_04520 [Lithospermum erythrorhizon]|uniref:Uncharacterized protein n=1 Tax=Lithospermum erythrorhizon TaxID=34254 RepID=A0AAV3NXX1_LITER